MINCPNVNCYITSGHDVKEGEEIGYDALLFDVGDFRMLNFQTKKLHLPKNRENQIYIMYNLNPPVAYKDAQLEGKKQNLDSVFEIKHSFCHN